MKLEKFWLLRILAAAVKASSTAKKLH